MSSADIDQILNDVFFQKYSRPNNYESLKEQVFEELRDRYGYPDRDVDKDDLLYLV